MRSLFGAESRLCGEIISLCFVSCMRATSVDELLVNCELARAEIVQSVQRLCYGLENREVGVQFPAGARDFFSVSRSFLIGSGVHPASYKIGNGMVLLCNRQHSKFVINNQCYCIIIRFIMYTATSFDPAGSSSGTFFLKCTTRYWIVFVCTQRDEKNKDR
jgi:hypothetical protein